jgi:hypothetical protein
MDIKTIIRSLLQTCTHIKSQLNTNIKIYILTDLTMMTRFMLIRVLPIFILFIISVGVFSRYNVKLKKRLKIKNYFKFTLVLGMCILIILTYKCVYQNSQLALVVNKTIIKLLGPQIDYTMYCGKVDYDRLACRDDYDNNGSDPYLRLKVVFVYFIVKFFAIIHSNLIN